MPMIGSIAVAILGLYLLTAEPLLGRLSYRRMLTALDAGVPGARGRFYLQWIWQGWALLVVTLIVTLGLAGWTPAQLGLRFPYWPHRLPLGHGALAGFVVGAAAALVAAVVLGIVSAYKRRRDDGDRNRTDRRLPAIAGNRDLMRMLPRTRDERFRFAALSVTAGISEEIVWRGFGLSLLLVLLPSLHPAVPIALAAIAFGWAHLYQGSIGVLVTATIGAALAILFWASGSLLWPILIHVLLDLRALLVRLPAHAVKGEQP